jgi:hypothetical protein
MPSIRIRREGEFRLRDENDNLDWAQMWEGDDTVMLDGHFSIYQLRAIVAFMEKERRERA